MEDSSELVMDWKEEPLSPIFADELTAVAYDEDARLYWNDPSEQCDVDQKSSFHNAEILLHNAPAIAALRNSSSTKAEPIDGSLLQNLEELEDLTEWIIEESSFPWLEDQIGYTTIEQKYATEDLLQEFENVLEAVNPGALTPPQSPPREQQPPPVLTTLEPITVGQIYPVVYTTTTQKIDDCPKTPQTLAHELAVVDELVRARANDILCETPPSPSTSNSGSFDDSSSSSEDQEWVPETVIESEKSRRRYKPYKNSPVDKKNRKKEQNKNAATRYRLKKKAEVEEILNEEKGVIKENEDLTSKISDLQREIRYLKGLMRDLFKAKGIIQ